MRRALLVVGGVLTCAPAAFHVWLGALVLGVMAAFYLSRAIEEILISPDFSAVISAVCLAIAGIHPVRPGGSFRRPAGSVAG